MPDLVHMAWDLNNPQHQSQVETSQCSLMCIDPLEPPALLSAQTLINNMDIHKKNNNGINIVMTDMS